MSQHLRYWDILRRPPKEALKKIGGGRLRGMTDIKPQWRIEAMTSCFGPCGVGWHYIIGKMWTEQLLEGEVMCFCNVELYFKENDIWSDGIPGTGGSMLVAKEKGGLHSNDEGFKMALTDALSVAMKSLGAASDIYMGHWDGSKYTTPGPMETKKPKSTISEHIFGCKDQKTLYEMLCHWEEKKPVGPDTINHWVIVISNTEQLLASRQWKMTPELNRFCQLVKKNADALANKDAEDLAGGEVPYAM